MGSDKCEECETPAKTSHQSCFNCADNPNLKSYFKAKQPKPLTAEEIVEALYEPGRQYNIDEFPTKCAEEGIREGIRAGRLEFKPLVEAASKVVNSTTLMWTDIEILIVKLRQQLENLQPTPEI